MGESKTIYACFRIRFTAETQRSQRQIFFLIQSGDGDWIRNSLPSELRSSLFIGYGRYDELSIRTTGTFFFGGISPPNKDFLLRVLGVCGQNFILDRYTTAQGCK